MDHHVSGTTRPRGCIGLHGRLKLDTKLLSKEIWRQKFCVFAELEDPSQGALLGVRFETY